MKPIVKILTFFFVIINLNAQTVSVEVFKSGFNSLVEIAHAGDERLFMVEKSGIIKILNPDATTNTTPFLDISNLVLAGGERGLLGLAFAPDYSTTGRFYVNYTNNSGNTVIARYTVSANPDIANPTGTILLTIPQPYSNHNGGKIAFNPDGYLFIATGDGGSSGDPGNRAQNKESYLGKLLRIDVSGTGYTSPSSNPFVGTTPGLDEIWAYGLRNPWKFSFDKSTGDIWIADVGQYNYEEINLELFGEAGGKNYGWNCREGANNYSSTTCGSTSTGFTEPVNEYNHNGGKCSITGGYRYRGNLYNSFTGLYFFADYCSGEIGYLTPNNDTFNITLQTPNITDYWTTFGEDVNGELYIAGNNTVYKLFDPNLSVNDNNYLNVKMYPNPAKDFFIVEANNNAKLNAATIYNLQGKKIRTIPLDNNSKVEIATTNLSKGIYFVEITAANNAKQIHKLSIF